LIIQTLGAGNIPTEAPYDLEPFIRQAYDLGIPVLLASQYPIHTGNLGRYFPSRRAIDAGAIPIANMTMAAMVAKLSWVLGAAKELPTRDEVLEQMLFNYVGEIDERDATWLRKAL
jgi:L-asparaginase/Glu-tRNA(Gln) amidotransferase subunit D